MVRIVWKIADGSSPRCIFYPIEAVAYLDMWHSSAGLGVGAARALSSVTVGAVAVQSNRKPARVAAALAQWSVGGQSPIGTNCTYTLPVVGVVCSHDQLGGIDVVSSAHVLNCGEW